MTKFERQVEGIIEREIEELREKSKLQKYSEWLDEIASSDVLPPEMNLSVFETRNFIQKQI